MDDGPAYIPDISYGRIQMKRLSFPTAIVVLLTAILMIASPDCVARDQQYEVKQIKSLNIDGQLDEWAEWVEPNIIVMEQVFGGAPPADPNDFTGSVMVAWNSDDPSRVYFAVKITDDVLQDIHPANDQHWHDDSMEFIFDSDNDGSADQFTLDANGIDLSASANADNTEYVVVSSGNEYVWEVAIVPAPGFQANVGDAIGLALAYNDSENGAREDQIRWIANENSWGAAANQGDLVFSADVVAAVEPHSKLAATWGSLRSR
jgi:hypothetical protein